MRFLFLTLSMVAIAAPARAQVVVKNQGYVPFGDAPIHYRSANLSDPIARLQQKLDRGEAALQFEPGHGYLRSVLRALAVPVSSQTLVFSKTSFQYPKISPERPRALYFNDDVYVGQVHDGHSLEFVSFGPDAGRDLLRARRAPDGASGIRAGDARLCAVPRRGVDEGRPRRDAEVGPHRSLGHAGERHAVVYQRARQPNSRSLGRMVRDGGVGLDRPHGQSDHPRGDSRGAYRQAPRRFCVPSPITSDMVAHLVLAHQTQMHNLITQTNLSDAPRSCEGARPAFRRRAAAVRTAGRTTGAVSAVRQRSAARRTDRRALQICGRVRREGSARCTRAVAARLRSAHSHFQSIRAAT